MAVVEMLALGGDVNHEDVSIVDVFRQPIGSDQHLGANFQSCGLFRLGSDRWRQCCGELRREKTNCGERDQAANLNVSFHSSSYLGLLCWMDLAHTDRHRVGFAFEDWSDQD